MCFSRTGLNRLRLSESSSYIFSRLHPKATGRTKRYHQNQLQRIMQQPTPQQPPPNPSHSITSYPRRSNSRNRKLRARPPILINTHARQAIIPRDTRRLAVGHNATITNIEARKEQVAAAAVLGAEVVPVKRHARRLADEVGAELRLPRALDDEDVGAEDLAGGDLPVGVRQGAGGVDDSSLWGGGLVGWWWWVGGGGHTSLVKVRHSLLGTPLICLKTRVLGPRTGPVGTKIWAEVVATAPRKAMEVVSFILTSGVGGLW